MDKSGKIMLDKRINLLYKDTYYDMLYVNENEYILYKELKFLIK
ncbi:MAG: hypothetical protein K0R49_422 [Burkholderiales bacterium]|jgi:hypothetical protein|nr:hypothetical protein [Burkholderiales bacterium]